MTRADPSPSAAAPEAASTARRGPARPRSTRTQVAVAALVVAAVALPVLLTGIAALSTVWRPSGDWAVLALRVRDVGASSPLVGPYSRYGWNHPGPMLYWVLAGPYHLLGQRPVDLLFGTALLNAVSMAGTAVLAWRRGRLPLLLLTGGVLALLARGLGPEVLRDPWNPYITLLPMALFAFLMWSVAEGERWPIPVGVVVGSFLVQSHVGYAVLAGAMAATAAVMAVLGHRRELAAASAAGGVQGSGAPLHGTGPPAPHRARRVWVVVLASALAVGVCWGPVVVDQLDGSRNLSGLVHYFTTSEEPTAGASAGLGFAARQLALPSAPWLGQAEPVSPDGGGQVPASPVGVVIPALAFLAALWAARRAGAASAVRFQVLVGVATLAGVAAGARITGDPYNYLLRWWWVLAALFWLSVVWSAGNAAVHWLRVPHTGHRAVRWIGVPAAIAVVVGLGAPNATAGSRAAVPDGSITYILGEVMPPTLDALHGYGPVLVRATGSVWGTAADGVRLELERAGVPIVAEPSDAFRLGPQRSADTRAPVATVWVVSADAATDWMRRPDLQLLARWDPLDPLARARYLVAEQELQRQLVAAGRPDLARHMADGGDTTGAPDVPGVDHDLVAQVEQVRRMGDPVAIFVGPPVD